MTSIQPIASDWLQLNVRYEGKGTSEFERPEAKVQGRGVARFDEQGNRSIEVLPEMVETDPGYEPFGLGFLSGSPIQDFEGGRSLGFGGHQNPCRSLSIEASDGLFTSTGRVHVSSWSMSLGGTRSKPLQFYVQEGKFETRNQNAPKFFAIPVINCLAELNDGLSGSHPLRIYPTPDIPADLDENDRLLARIRANAKNQVCGFYLEGKVCFIEALADFDSRSESLKSGSRRRATAVLVGELPDRPVSSLADFRSWFPFELFSALSFASGTEVGFPWIEIRDEHGGLIRRLHGAANAPHFWEGDRLLGKFASGGAIGGLGAFLTSYLMLPAQQRSYLEVAMDHARLGSFGAPVRLYDMIDHLVRALECLCREHNFVQQDLLMGLSDRTRQEVKKLISEVTQQIGQLKADPSVAGQWDEQRLLNTIQGRTANVGTTEKKFGLSVVSLLNKFGFPDVDIIDRFVAMNPRVDGLRDWASILTSYRGATIHEGYMDFQTKHDASDVVRVCAHLKDVIARLVFKEAGYGGTYESPLLRNFGPQPVHWVQPNTTPDKLGFE